MPLYVTMLKWTNQGAKASKESPKRARSASTKLQDRLGVKTLQVLYTSGRYDLIRIFEAPDDETATAAALSMAGAGNVQTETMRAYSIDEMEKIAERLP